MTKEKLRVVILGASRRSNILYGPLIQGMKDEVELVGVWGRSPEPAQQLSGKLGVPAYTDLDKLVSETSPHIGVVSVTYAANGIVGRMAVEAGLNVLVETPIAHNLDEADAIIAAAQARGLKVEVAEQFHRRPLEQIKLKLIAEGVFGKVYSSFNDFSGHGYHGVSVMRSYLGFDARPVRVTGSVHTYPLAAHWARNAGTRGERTETQEHGLVEFEGGQVGVFHWTSAGYDSALRWWRSSRFLAEKGMGVTVSTGMNQEEQLSLLTPDGEAPQMIQLERRYERSDGGPLISIAAHTGDASHPTVVWENPLRGGQWHEDEIGVAGCLLSLVNAVRNGTEPSYGAHQGRLDQEIILALRQSAAQGGIPINLPLITK